MPKRTDLKRILVIGSGPIVIGQACEFDYSGTQACKALRDEGLEVVLVNSNPATIMTDPELADRTYVEPLTVEMLEKVIERERPDAVLPTVGGQTALNLAIELEEKGVLAKYNVALIGASVEAIRVAEDRQKFKEAMRSIGIDVPDSACVNSLDLAIEAGQRIGFPLIIRPSFTLGGVGGGIAYNIEEFREICTRGLSMSPVHEILVEQSVIGWKEFELEVMRDCADNFVVICSIENIDPMGVHTGDSITVAPALTLTDKEYQRMRDAARRIIRRVGVETGGSNIQFAINPADGHMVAIEMNPRVSRSSALASKATGFPIAKIAAKLALGYRLDEIPNDITKLTPASFEPTIDYVVTKVPRWAFEKFPQADRTLTTQMKSVGEAMALGRTFKESFLKAFRSLELGRSGLLFGQHRAGGPYEHEDDTALQQALGIPTDRRMWAVFRALDKGWSIDEIHRLTHIDRWFLTQFAEIVEMSRAVSAVGMRDLSDELLLDMKRAGFGDADLATLLGTGEDSIRERRREAGIVAAYKRIDTCAAEFESFTPYMYGTFEQECEANPNGKRKVVILGSGPNRIGQGIEFDYCCCHAAFALREQDYETVMVNCNPETVSTDYDTVDRLYFEPLTFENVHAIIEREKSAGAEVACVVQYGGQTPLKLALELQAAGVRILGTSPDSIDLAEDRKRFSRLLWDLGIPQAASGTATSQDEARAVATEIGFPVVVRPSYVLGGRAMAIVYDMAALDRYMRHAVQCIARASHPDRQVPGRRHRDRRGLSRRRRRRRRHRRHHGAHRAGRHPLRRQLLRGANLQTQRPARGHDPRLHAPNRARAERRRPHEHPVRRERRRGVRAGSESACLPHHPLFVQGHRHAARQSGRQAHDRPDARAAGPHRGPAGLRVLREDPGVPVRPVPRRGHAARPRNEVHGRGDGRRRVLRHRVRQGADGCRSAAAARRDRVHQREQSGQGGCGANRARAFEPGLSTGGHARHGGVPARTWPQRGHHLQGE